jgi:hypothetical protein
MRGVSPVIVVIAIGPNLRCQESPYVHPVAAGVWSVLKHLRVRHPLKGFGRLLERFP